VDKSSALADKTFKPDLLGEMSLRLSGHGYEM